MGESEFEQMQAEYLKRLRHQLRGIPSALREDAICEVQAHIEDGCRQNGNDVTALQAVLERLGPPEEFGHELGLQLMLQANRIHPSLNMLVWTGLYWASTSIVGMFVILGATFLYLLGFAFLADGFARLLYPSMSLALIKMNDIAYPPPWWPPLNMFTGILIICLLTIAVVLIVRGWGRGSLGRRGLVATLNRETLVLSKGWERRATLTITVMALAGLFGCSIFGALGGMVPIGRYGTMVLPNDFFKNPFNFIAFLGALTFLLSPVLGILWAVWREQRKNNL